MDRRSRIAIFFAAVLSIPLVALALRGAVYIAYSLVSQPWYRELFWAYGTRLLVLYTLYAAGVAAAASVALRYHQRQRAAMRVGLIVASVVGLVAAALLEMLFWSEDDRFIPRGALLLPFVAWAIIALRERYAVRAVADRP